MKTKTLPVLPVTKISKGMRFLGSEDPQDIFTTLYPNENFPNVWNCKHIQLEGEWGFEEKFILSGLIPEEKVA